jgi:hypothetical protein
MKAWKTGVAILPRTGVEIMNAQDLARPIRLMMLIGVAEN